MVEKKQYENLLKELKIMKKLLTASLYVDDVSSENLSKITGMDAADIRKLVSKRKRRDQEPFRKSQKKNK